MVQQQREEVYAALQDAASFHCLVKEWKDCEELSPRPQEKQFCVKKKKSKEASHGVVCGSKQILVYEMHKKRQNLKTQGTCEGTR